MSDKKKIILDAAEVSTAQEIQDIYNEAVIAKSAAPTTTADLIKSAMGFVQSGKRVPRLAFNENPMQKDSYAGVFKYKSTSLPFQVIKKIRVQNLLVAAIVRTRGSQMSMFGHIKNNRFDIGIELKIKKQFKDSIEPEELEQIKDRMDQFIKLLLDCGKTEGLREKDKMTLSEFLSLQCQNGVSFGWFGTELIWEDPGTYKKLHRFRPVDSGSIYHALKRGEYAEGTRQSSIRWLEEQQGIKINKDILQKDEYDYVQVIDGTPRQAFTSKELIMYNLYPTTDIEHNSYPITPLDTVINAVTTHSSIEVYNKLYFQNGKSAKGMLVIKSDNIDENTIQDMKQQFQASINNVNNSFKIPIFGVSREDEVAWISTMPNRKDGEFEYLFDQTTRNILAAFNMSPDELPGFAHLSRGANQQALSEGNNEFKLTAQRDSGIRPLILKFQDFFNEKLFPLLDPELSQLCDIHFSGLDAETRQQESNLLMAEMPIHMTYDEVMDIVDKTAIGEEWGGRVPMNERYLQGIDKYSDVSDIVSKFYKTPSAQVDPVLKYKRDQFWMQNMQMLSQFNPAALKAYYAPKPHALDILKMNVQDMLEEDEVE
jgi:hypothetical protein